MDTLSKRERSHRMSLVKSKNTKPERRIEKLLKGLRVKYEKYGLLPGSPDFVLPRKKRAIFVHGCFWHRHAACHNGRRTPKSRLAFWLDKLDKNKKRDLKNLRQLNRLGWRYLVIWECRLGDERRLTGRLNHFVRGKT